MRNHLSNLLSAIIIVSMFGGITSAQEPRAWAVPRVLSAEANSLPKAEFICSPSVRTYIGYTRRVLHLHDGNTVAVFSYAGNFHEANWLFLINTFTLETSRYSIPNGDRASHGAALGADGNIYIMPFESGRAYCFDVKQRKFTALDINLPQFEMTWDAIGASNGCIYFGTYPNAIFGEYNIITEKTRLFKKVRKDASYVWLGSEDANHCITLRATGPGLHHLTFNPVTGIFSETVQTKMPTPAAAQPVSVKPPSGDEYMWGSPYSGLQQIGQRRFVISFPSSRFWELDELNNYKLIAQTNAPAETWFFEQVRGGLLGISHFGSLLGYNVNTGKVTISHLKNDSPGGNGLMFIEAISPHCVIGGNYSQQNLFDLDPESGRINSTDGLAVKGTGEADCAAAINDKAYIGIYVSAIMAVYDPAKPFKFGANPKELIRLDKDYHQTRPRDAVTDGKKVYISSDSEYNIAPGGTLTVVDPQTDHVDVFANLIAGQNMTSLAYDPVTRLVWGGTDRWGQCRSHPPTEPNALIYAFDPNSRTIAARIIAWPGADEAIVLGISSNGLMVATDWPREKIAVIDTASRKIVYNGPFWCKGNIPLRMRRGFDGDLYFPSSGIIYRWVSSNNVIEPLAAAPGCLFMTQTTADTWCVADETSIYRIRLSK